MSDEYPNGKPPVNLYDQAVAAFAKFARLFMPSPAPESKNLDALAASGRELGEPVTPFEIIITRAVSNALRRSQDPVEILCGETVSFEQLRAYITRMRAQTKPVSDPVVRDFIVRHAIPEVSTRLYSLGHAVRAVQGKQ